MCIRDRFENTRYRVAALGGGVPAAKRRAILAELESEMKASAKALDFERAAQLRDELLALRELL